MSQRTMGVRLSLTAALWLGLGWLLVGCQSAEERAVSYTEHGESLLEDEEFLRASLDFRNALQINPEYIPALKGLAAAEEGRGNEAAALTLYSRAIILAPDELPLRLKAMQLMLSLGQFGALGDLSEETLEMAPDDADALAMRAAFFLRLGQNDSAVSHATQALELDPGNRDALLVLAAERMRADDAPAALAYLDQGMRGNLLDPSLRLLKVQILEKTGDQEGAEQEYASLIETFPLEPAYRRGYAMLLMRGGRYGQAENELRQIILDRPGDINAALDLVRMLRRAHGDVQAEAELRSLRLAGYDGTELTVALAELLEDKGALEEAIGLLTDAAGSSENTLHRMAYLAALGQMQLRAGAVEEVANIVEAILAEDSRSADALMLRAELAVRRRELDDAIADLRTIMVDEPHNWRAAMALGRSFELKGALSIAESQYIQAFRFSDQAIEPGLSLAEFLANQGDLPRAEETLMAIVARHPSDRASLRALASLRLKRQDYAGAQQVADALTELGEESYLTRQIEAAVLAGVKDSAGSITLMREAFSSAPADARPLVGLVGVYIKNGRSEEAVRFLENLVEAERDNIQPLVMLAELKAALGERSEAEALFKSVRAEHSVDFYPWRAAYGFYAQEGRFEEARKVLDEALENVEEPLNVQLLQAELYQFEDRFEEAIAVYENLHAAAPNVAVVANNLASLLCDHRTDAASYRKALTLAERFKGSRVPEFQDTLGWALYKNGDLDAAARVLLSATEMAPALAPAHYHLGVVLMALGDRIAAREAFASAQQAVGRADGALLEDIESALAQL